MKWGIVPEAEIHNLLLEVHGYVFRPWPECHVEIICAELLFSKDEVTV